MNACTCDPSDSTTIHSAFLRSVGAVSKAPRSTSWPHGTGGRPIRSVQPSIEFFRVRRSSFPVKPPLPSPPSWQRRVRSSGRARGSAPAHRPKLAPAHAALWKSWGRCSRRPVCGPMPWVTSPKRSERSRKRLNRRWLMPRGRACSFASDQIASFRPATLRKLGEIAEGLARESGAGVVTVAALRDRAGIGRNVSIEVLEYFDRIKFTERVGDARKVMRPCNVAFGGAEHEIMPYDLP